MPLLQLMGFRWMRLLIIHSSWHQNLYREMCKALAFIICSCLGVPKLYENQDLQHFHPNPATFDNIVYRNTR